MPSGQSDRTDVGGGSTLLRAIEATLFALGVVERRVGNGFQSPRHRQPPVSQADYEYGGTTTRMTSASAVAVVAVLCRVDDV